MTTAPSDMPSAGDRAYAIGTRLTRKTAGKKVVDMVDVGIGTGSVITVDDNSVVSFAEDAPGVVVRSALEGTGTPAPSLGENGSIYIDTAANELYYKASDTWRKLTGDQGKAGDDGKAPFFLFRHSSTALTAGDAPTGVVVKANGTIDDSGDWHSHISASAEDVYLSYATGSPGDTLSFSAPILLSPSAMLFLSKLTTLVQGGNRIFVSRANNQLTLNAYSHDVSRTAASAIPNFAASQVFFGVDSGKNYAWIATEGDSYLQSVSGGQVLVYYGTTENDITIRSATTEHLGQHEVRKLELSSLPSISAGTTMQLYFTQRIEASEQVIDARVKRITDLLDIRLDLLEAFEDTFRTRTDITTDNTIVVGARHTAYTLTGATTVPANTAGAEVEITVKAAGVPDGVGTFKLSELYAKTPVVRDGLGIDSNSGLVVVNTPDNNEYYIGRDTSGDWFFGSDTADTYTISITITTINIPTSGGSGGGLSQGQVDARIATWARIHNADTLPVAKIPTEIARLSEVATWAQTGNTNTIPDTKISTNIARVSQIPTSGGGGGGGDSNKITAVAALPATADSSVGDIVNYNGVLYELVLGTVDPHIYRSTIAKRTGNFYGDNTFMWEAVNPFNIRANLTKTILGATPPNTLYVEFHASTGEYVEITLSRAPASDTSTLYAYNRTPGSTAIGSATVGDTFSAAFYSDEAKNTQVRVQESVNRWERDDRNEVQVEKWAIPGTDLTDDDRTDAQFRLGTVDTKLYAYRPFGRHNGNVVATETTYTTGIDVPSDASGEDEILVLLGTSEPVRMGTVAQFLALGGSTAGGLQVDGRQIAVMVGGEQLDFWRLGTRTIGVSFDNTTWSAGDGFDIKFRIRTSEIDAQVETVAIKNTSPTAAQQAAFQTKIGVHRVPGNHLITHSYPGITLTRTDQSVFEAAPTYFSPAFDLDDNPRGEFHASLRLTIAPTSDANMGFVRGKANQTAEDRQVDLSAIEFASELSEQDDFVYSTTEALNGITMFEQPAYSLNTLVGTYRMLLVHNSDNHAATYHWWEGAAGATGAAVSANLRLTFTPSDAVEPGGSGAGQGDYIGGWEISANRNRTGSFGLSRTPHGFQYNPTQGTLAYAPSNMAPLVAEYRGILVKAERAFGSSSSTIADAVDGSAVIPWWIFTMGSALTLGTGSVIDIVGTSARPRVGFRPAGTAIFPAIVPVSNTGFITTTYARYLNMYLLR